MGGANGKSHLLRNLGGGRFDDVTAKAGLSPVGEGRGCAAGDFDNDGKTDLAVCESGGVRLLHNEGNGKFVDVTEKVRIRPEKGCVALTFVDYDHDGDLDLYVTSTGSGADGEPARNVMCTSVGMPGCASWSVTQFRMSVRHTLSASSGGMPS